MSLPVTWARTRRDSSARLLCMMVLVIATGCASGPAVFGNEARYSPAFAGYVMAKDRGSDDPDSRDEVLVLRDPLTGKKLRCQNEVTRWRELHEDLAADRAHDDNTAIAVGVVTGAVFGTLAAPSPVGALVLAEGMMTSDALYEAFASASGTALLARGVVLYKRKRFRQAAETIERALAKDPSVGINDQAFFYLGMSYAETKQSARAKVALEQFLDRANVRDVKAYRSATKKLGELGVRRPECGSTDPVELHW